MTRVAIQGIRGSYSEEAATRMFGDSLELVECTDFAAAFSEADAEDTAVLVPVRNSIVGEIAATNLLIRSTGLRRIDEIELRIQHVLAARIGTDIEKIRRVRSHPEALRQCSRFLGARPYISTEPGPDTATSIRDIAVGESNDRAAIGSRRAAEIYSARVLCEDVADAPDNRTTFYLLGK
jgi:prephenate dehydratase